MNIIIIIVIIIFSIRKILSVSALYLLPSYGLQVLAVSLHSVKIHPRSVDKAACYLYLVVLEAVHHWSVSIGVFDVKVNSSDPKNDHQLSIVTIVSHTRL